jgi:phosphatidylglycerophosphate synthase
MHRQIFPMVPELLVWSRCAAGFVILISSLAAFDRGLLSAVFTYGFLSDILDGMIARKLGVATERLRKLDSSIDTLFYLCSFAAITIHRWDIVRGGLLWIAVIIGLKTARYLFDYVKFRKETSYHMYSAKLWGITLFLFYMDLLLNNRLGVMFGISVSIGVLTNVESLIASVLLDKWEHDVPSIITVLGRRPGKGRVGCSHA